MGGLAEERVRLAVRSLVERDPSMMAQVIAGDADINQFHVEIDDRCFKLLALHQPMAGDLRSIVAAGHTIGNHSYSHPSATFWCLPAPWIEEEIDRCNAILGNDWDHHQSGNGIHPPPTKECIQQEATQENRRKVRTEIRLASNQRAWLRYQSDEQLAVSLAPAAA